MSVALAVELARPVVRSMLPLELAEAALAVALAREERAGTSPGTGSFDEKWRIDCHILRLNVEIQEDARDKAIGIIVRRIQPLIDSYSPIGRVRAEAHDVNADRGFMLSEPEVEGVIIQALYRAEAKVRAQSPRRPMRRYHAY
jgi:hypothetical protein